MGNVFTLEGELEEDARRYWITPRLEREEMDNLLKSYTDARTDWVMDNLEKVGVDFDTDENWNLVLNYSDETGIPPVDLIIWSLHKPDSEFDLDSYYDPDEETNDVLRMFADVLIQQGLREPNQTGGALVEDVSEVPGVGHYTEEGKQGFLESVNEVRRENNLPPLNEAQSEDVLTALFVMRSGFAELERIKGSPIEE